MVIGNKIYSPDTCVLAPVQINNLILDSGAIRGDYPIGVCFHKATRKFTATLKDGKKRKSLGYFDSSERAAIAYQKAKKQRIREVALEWKDRIDERLFNALMQRAM